MASKNIEIDVAGICTVDYRCDGCVKSSKRCCSSYEVTISRQEMRNIIDYIPFAAHFCSNLKKKGHYVNVFEEISNSLFSIDTNEDGLCVFSYFEKNKIVCSLHSVAEKFGIPVQNIKPTSCLLWPLAISDGNKKILSVQDDIFEFSCIRKNIEGIFSLCPSIADNIEKVFGNNFKKYVQDAVNKKLQWVKNP